MAATLGFDFATFPTLDSAFTPRAGNRSVAERLRRRLTTRRGSLLGQEGQGVDVRELLLESVDELVLLSWKVLLEEECRREEAVEDVAVDLEFFPASGQLTVYLGFTTLEGPFNMTLAVGELVASRLA